MTVRVIAIDGPAASGKSSTAAAVARQLGWGHLDSGALYRAITLAALDNLGDESRGTGDGWSPQRILALAEDLPVRLVLVNDVFKPEIAGVDVAKAIRAERVTERVSVVAAVPQVRAWVNARQRQAVLDHPRGVVVDGRDIGTVVFPDAPLKVFLTASPEERARRRLLQRREPVNPADVQREAAILAERDRADSTRAVAPLKPAADAVGLDTTSMDQAQQVSHVVALARDRLPG